MLDSIYHITQKLHKNHIFFGRKIFSFLPYFTQWYDVITQHYKICKPLVVYRFYCVISLPHTTSCDNSYLQDISLTIKLQH